MDKSREASKKTVRLETLSRLYDVPLWTLRKWASRRRFPGIIRRHGERRVYVDIERFDDWFRRSEGGE